LNLPDYAQEYLDKIEMRDGVSSLESLAINEDSSIRLPWLADMVAMFAGIGQFMERCSLVEAY
jgi:hypothetical protein